jgi:ADP-heptose:LPS heptosyltransferase
MGKAACFILTGHRRIVDMFLIRNATPPPTRKILFIKLIEQGATVLAYSAIGRAVQMVGRENVFFCVFEENWEILDILDVIPHDNIFAVRHNNFFIFLFDVARFLVNVRRLEIDATVDMEFFARASALLAYLTGARRRVGMHRYTSEAPYRGDLMTHRIQYNPYLHTAKTYNLLVEALKWNTHDVPLIKTPIDTVEEVIPEFIPREEETSHIKEMLRHRFGREIEGPLVLLNPNASDLIPIRKWPVEHFIGLGTLILSHQNTAMIAITGTLAEREAAEDICRKLGSSRVMNLAGETSLRSLMVLYTLSDVLVTNDSGPAHFASMTDIDTVVLYGPETPKLYGSRGNRFHAIQARLACSPCVNVFNHRFSPCTNNICLQMISPEEIYDKVLSCLQKRRGS